MKTIFTDAFITVIHTGNEVTHIEVMKFCLAQPGSLESKKNAGDILQVTFSGTKSDAGRVKSILEFLGNIKNVWFREKDFHESLFNSFLGQFGEVLPPDVVVGCYRTYSAIFTDRKQHLAKPEAVQRFDKRQVPTWHNVRNMQHLYKNYKFKTYERKAA